MDQKSYHRGSELTHSLSLCHLRSGSTLWLKFRIALHHEIKPGLPRPLTDTFSFRH